MGGLQWTIQCWKPAAAMEQEGMRALHALQKSDEDNVWLCMGSWFLLQRRERVVQLLK